MIIVGWKNISAAPAKERLSVDRIPTDLQRSIKRVGDYGKFMAKKTLLLLSVKQVVWVIRTGDRGFISGKALWFSVMPQPVPAAGC